MKEMVAFLAKQGYWLLFVSVVGRQACLPVPANLLLVAAGALAGLGKLSLIGIVAVSVAAFILADLAWYEAGLKWGGKTLHLVCGSSRNPASCVAQMTERFSRHGVNLLLVSKFIIGLDAVAAPLAGISRTDRRRFLLFDATGAVLWSSAYVALGWTFSDQLDRVATYSGKIGDLALFAGAAALAVLIVRKVVRWHRFLREFRLARITPDQLMDKLNAGENILILDLQGNAKHVQGLMAIPGAVRINPRRLEGYKREYRDRDLATDREVILYCNCPGEYTSAHVALMLRELGFEHVRPLAGGLRAWRERGFPVTSNVETLTSPEHAAFVLREIFQYSRTNAARLLKTSATNIDRLLKQAKQRIEHNRAADLLLLKKHGTPVPAESKSEVRPKA